LGDFIYEDDLKIFDWLKNHLRDHRLCVIEIRDPLEESGSVPVPSLIEDVEGRGISKSLSDLSIESYQIAKLKHQFHLEEIINQLGANVFNVRQYNSNNLIRSLYALMRWGEL